MPLTHEFATADLLVDSDIISRISGRFNRMLRLKETALCISV